MFLRTKYSKAEMLLGNGLQFTDLLDPICGSAEGDLLLSADLGVPSCSALICLSFLPDPF